MIRELFADWVFLGSFLLGLVLVFPWLTSVGCRWWTRGKFPIFGELTAIVGGFLLAVSVGLALVARVLLPR